MVLSVAMRPGVARCVFLAGLFLGVAQAQTTVPGKIPGEFAVSPSGAATYRIPIEVPPGVAGMQPQLALSYNSQAGNGIMGMGWSIEGLSAITRCPKTMATDGVRGGVNHNTEDRFCLDGQRLINVAGAYGAAGSEYRTELESFSRITAHGAAAGNAANGPERFTVQTKAGLTMEYGGTAVSRIEAQGKSVVRVWALNRTVDAKGNAIDYNYTEDNANGQYLIDTVSFAGGEVKFAYESRPDAFRGYQAGSKISQTWRLKSLETYSAGQAVQRSDISYLSEAATRPSLVEKITRCSSTQVNCFPSLDLTWTRTTAPGGMGPIQRHADNIFTPASGWFTAGIHNRVWVTDMNADGLPDILGATDSGLYWQLNTGTGFAPYQGQSSNTFRPAAGWFIPNIHNRVWVTDINGDRLPDILAADQMGYYWQLNTGNGFGALQSQADIAFKPGNGWFSTSIHNRVWLTDMNADGLPDILGATDSGLYWQLNTGSGFAPAQGQTYNPFRPAAGWFTTGIHERVWVTDINGDGLPDILGADGSLYWQLNTGNGFGPTQYQADNIFTPASGWFTKFIHNRVWLTDINADGLPDILGATDSGLYWQLNTGTGFAPFQSQSYNTFRPSSGWFTTSIYNRVWVTDINGDGLPDILAADQMGYYWQLNTGSGFGALQSQADNVFLPGGGWFTPTIHNRVWLTDVDGDGQQDLLGATNSGLYWQLAQGAAMQLSAIGQGGSRVELAYAALTQTPGYVKDSTGQYPRGDLRIPIQVVREISQPNGLGGQNKTTYSYGGLKAEQASAQHPGSGRGMLGFRWMKTLEDATGIETYTEFSQSWPTIGQVIKSETRLAGAGNAGLLKQTTSSYGCYQSAAAAGTSAPTSSTQPCGPWSPGKVYFPHLVSSTEDSWDLDGTAMPRLSTTQTFDGYAEQSGGVRQFGDPTQIRVDIHQGGALQQRKDTTNEYHPARTTGGQWQLGRLKRASVSSTQY